MDPALYVEVQTWRDNPTMERGTGGFIGRIFAEDIDLCLKFADRELQNLVHDAVLSDNICIEEVNPRHSATLRLITLHNYLKLHTY